MSVLFCDSSALVKRYLHETGSAWIASLLDPSSGHTVIIAEITRVEVAAAFAARQRAKNGISLAERDRLFKLLVRHSTDEYRVAPVSVAVVDQAMLLTQRHRLRGYDAVQLAAALLANQPLIAAGLPALTFIAADEDLIAAARTEGLPAENPNAYS